MSVTQNATPLDGKGILTICHRSENFGSIPCKRESHPCVLLERGINKVYKFITEIEGSQSLKNSRLCHREGTIPQFILE